MIQDMATRRALDANNQNIEYLLRRAKLIRKRPDDAKFPVTNVAKLALNNQKSKTPVWPKPVMVSAVWVEPTSGTLTGIVNPNNSPCDYSFWYMSVAYDPVNKVYPPADFTNATKTTPVVLAPGSVGVNVTATITGLTVPARYYVMIVATNASGQAFSNVVTMDTGLAPTVVIEDATAVSYNAGTLNATVNPNSLATTYQFSWGTTPACENVLGSYSCGSGMIPVDVAEPIAGLAEATKYYFKVTATNAVGTTVSAFTTFVTPYQM
jgi:hypothetical protein